MGVLAIMIRGIRISGLLFVMVRKLLVLNVTPGTRGAEWEESNKSLPMVVICWYYRISESPVCLWHNDYVYVLDCCF